MVGGVGDNAVSHGINLGTAGGGKVGAAVSARAKDTGDVLVGRQCRPEVQRAGQRRLAVFVDLGVQIGIQLGSRFVQVLAGLFFLSRQHLRGGLRIGDGGILLLDTGLQFGFFAVQLVVLALQLGLLGLQLRLGVFQLGALGSPVLAFRLDLLADFLVLAGDLFQRLGNRSAADTGCWHWKAGQWNRRH